MKRITGGLTQSRLHEVLDYDHLTGVFRWLTGRRKGQTAGTRTPQGYLCIYVDGTLFKAHRLAWVYVHGEWPEIDTDHRNEVKDDNRIANLRAVTRSENNQNRSRPQTNNAAGYRGVWAHQGRFRAGITVGGKKTYLGCFDTPEEAGRAYVRAKQELHIGDK